MGDYDFEPKQKPGKFLRLKDKGQVIKVRLASRPYRNPLVWTEGQRLPMDDKEASQLQPADWYRIMANAEQEIREAFCWVVIDRADGQARILSVAPSVYRSIQEYAKDVDWGDPTTYDITITRTEEPGRAYYSVKPAPNKTPLSDVEKSRVYDLNISKEMPCARPTSDRQVDDIDDYIMQMAGHATINKHEDETPAEDLDDTPPANPDAVIEDIGSEPINLDDIPFSEDDASVSKPAGKAE